MQPPSRQRRTASALALITAAASAFLAVPGAPTAAASAPGDRDVTAELFEWRYDSVAQECASTLGPAGYGYVEVSPATEHIQGSQWWTSYQPVSYKIAGRLGDRASFQHMVDTCHAAGVKVVADAVINHMAAGSGTGTGGSTYTKYNYPGIYQSADMDDCTSPVTNYADRWNVQHCELVGLADLDTGEPYVRTRIAQYLNDLLSLGVDGLRIDAAKHIAAEDIGAIKSQLSNPNVYLKQEVIYGAGEAVQPSEYLGNGDVQEFRYGRDLKRVFTGEKLAELKNFGEAWGYVPSSQAGRVRRQLGHRTQWFHPQLQGRRRTTPSRKVFMLAWPYGSPDVHSGYEFTDNDAGPPNDGTVKACCHADGWKCQHRWPQIQSMVGFHNTARGEAVTNWWDNGTNQIAFGRGAKAYVAINHESVRADPHLPDLAAGRRLLRRAERQGRHGRLRRALHRHPGARHRARPPGELPHLWRRFEHGQRQHRHRHRARCLLRRRRHHRRRPEHLRHRRPGRARQLESGRGPQARPRGLPRVEARRRAAGRHVVRVQVRPRGRERPGHLGERRQPHRDRARRREGDAERHLAHLTRAPRTGPSGAPPVPPDAGRPAPVPSRAENPVPCR